jgi:HlyD family secretion protein
MNVYVNRTHVGQKAQFDYSGKTYELEIQKIYSNIAGGAFEVDLFFTGDAPEWNQKRANHPDEA